MFYKVQDILKYMGKLEDENLDILSCGNISVRLDKDKIAIKPSGLSYNEVNISNISIVDLTGRQISGLKPSSDLASHLIVYKNKENINCIIHSHSHYATVMSTLVGSLKIFSTIHADYFGREIHSLPYINHRNNNFGQQLVNANEDVAFLERHGTVVINESIEKAFKNIVVLEEISKINYDILCFSKSIKQINSKDVKILNHYYYKDYGQKYYIK